MTPEELTACFKMKKHPENGFFLEKHYDAPDNIRPASGMIYYYVAENELTDFHKIDCDEYWCFNAGASLEVWTIDETKELKIRLLGIENDHEPSLFIPKGTIFASRHPKNVS